MLLAPPKNHLILPGITYDVVIEIANAHKMPLALREVSEHAGATAEEIWVTSSTKERSQRQHSTTSPVGEGKPGPLFRRMHPLYQEFKQTVRRRAA